MARRAVIFLCAFGLFQKGLSALVETQHTVMAAVGEDACLQCQLMRSKNVLQVTWQKILTVGEENIATYTRKFGQTVNAGFKGRVEFKTAGLQNCSINILNVTERDEGFYRCLFNTIPEGAFIGRTCLQIYELHEPFLHVVDSVVSCSATGRPAPTVTLDVTPYNSTSVANSNGTFTVTVTARLHNNSREVGCAAQVLSAPQKEASMAIPGVKMLAIKGSEEDSRPDNSGVALALIIVSVVLFCVCVAVAITAFLCIRKHLKSVSEKDSERTKTPQKSTKDSLETQTPLMKEENELRQRTPGAKNNNNSETSHLKVKNNLFP